MQNTSTMDLFASIPLKLNLPILKSKQERLSTQDQPVPKPRHHLDLDGNEY